MSKVNKKAYTLIEIAITLSILSLVIGAYMWVGKTLYDKNRFEDTQNDMQNIKKVLIAYAATNAKLPKVDSNSSIDGEGDTNGTIGYFPFIDLNTLSKDHYGMVYQYDVLDMLTETNESTICDKLKDVNDTVDQPLVINDTSDTNYSVAAIVISRGKNKVLTGNNAVANRVYEMADNRFNADENDDLVLELSILELFGKICEN